MAGALNLCELLFFGNLVLLFGEDGVGQDAQNQSAGNGPDFHSAEGDSHTADTHNEDDAGGEEVAVLVQVNLLEHLEAGGGDEAVESDADAAHDAGGDGLQEADQRSDQGEENTDKEKEMLLDQCLETLTLIVISWLMQIIHILPKQV